MKLWGCPLNCCPCSCCQKVLTHFWLFFDSCYIMSVQYFPVRMDRRGAQVLVYMGLYLWLLRRGLAEGFCLLSAFFLTVIIHSTLFTQNLNFIAFLLCSVRVSIIVLYNMCFYEVVFARICVTWCAWGLGRCTSTYAGYTTTYTKYCKYAKL